MTDSEPDVPAGESAGEGKKRRPKTKNAIPVRPVESGRVWKELARTLGVNSLYDPALVNDCIQRFRKNYKDVDHKHPFFHGTIGSAAHIHMLWDEDTRAEHLSKETQLKLVAFMNTRDPTLTDRYGSLSQMIDQDPRDRQRLIDQYKGTYRYFRFQPPSPGEKEVYNFGKVVIGHTGDRPTFEMWSANMDRRNADSDFAGTSPENTGEIFCGNGKLYFVGHRKRVMRLAICREPTNDLAQEMIRGILLSVTSHTNDPFAARFVLIHESNQSDMERYDNFDVPKDGKIWGQRNFEDLWGDKNNMMMLIPRSTGYASRKGSAEQ